MSVRSWAPNGIVKVCATKIIDMRWNALIIDALQQQCVAMSNRYDMAVDARHLREGVRGGGRAHALTKAE